MKNRNKVNAIRDESEDLFLKIIDELSEIGFSGEIHPHLYNEPLLDERLGRFVKYIKKKLPESEVIVFSNGIYLTIEKMEGVCLFRDFPLLRGGFRNLMDRVSKHFERAGLKLVVIEFTGGPAFLLDV